MKKWIFIFLLLILISGCGTNNEAREENGNQQQMINVKNSTIQNIDRETGQQISEHLVQLASSIPNVKDTTAVVLGRYALVGIDVNEDIDRSQVGAIKYSVAESLKNDPHGARAIVVADPDITARIREIGEDIQAGKPVQGIINELADISGRLMPEVPADITEPEKNNKGTEEQKQKLNKKESKELEKQQEEQSKHHKD